jgi:hypothetical protein
VASNLGSNLAALLCRTYVRQVAKDAQTEMDKIRGGSRKASGVPAIHVESDPLGYCGICNVDYGCVGRDVVGGSRFVEQGSRLRVRVRGVASWQSRHHQGRAVPVPGEVQGSGPAPRRQVPPQVRGRGRV